MKDGGLRFNGMLLLSANVQDLAEGKIRMTVDLENQSKGQ